MGRENDCIILTNDLDFGAMLAAGAMSGPSVVQVRGPNVSVDALGLEIVEILRQHADFLNRGALVVVDIRRNRIRLLPIESK